LSKITNTAGCCSHKNAHLNNKDVNTTDEEQADAAQLLQAPGRCCVHCSLHLPGGSTFLREMTSWPPSGNYDVVSEK